MTQYYEYSNRVKLDLVSPGQKASPIEIFLIHGNREKLPGKPGIDPGDLVINNVKDDLIKLYVSIGEKDKATQNAMRIAGAAIAKWLRQFKKTTSTIHLKKIKTLTKPGFLSAFIEGLYLGAYDFSKYKFGNSDLEEIQIVLDLDIDNNAVMEIIHRAKHITDAVNLDRDWCHEPANVINPISLAERAQFLAQKTGLKCTILDDRLLTNIKAGGLLSVGKGSSTPSRLIILEYPGTNPERNTKPVVLVGKAITFDTGGYSLKDPTNIQQMKFDKSGGVAVIAVMQAASRLKIKQPIIGIIAAAENMISEKAYRPDDILTTLSGKTVEIFTTDTEGRLVLADALTYAQNTFTPSMIIDLATLTGGVIVALGRVRAGLLSNNQKLAKSLFEAGEKTAERLWQLPLDDDYFKQIEGDDADLKNSGGREASTIIGGTFLKQFVSDDVPWAHIDIAGVANQDKPGPIGPKGATGYGVRLLINFLENLN